MEDHQFTSTTDNDFEKVDVPKKNDETEEIVESKKEKCAEKTNYLCCKQILANEKFKNKNNFWTSF